MRSVLVFFAFISVGCGTSSTTNNDGGGGGDGGCINATAGGSCSSSDTACALGGDVCCSGFYMCQSGTWVKEFPGCACQTGTFTCGTQTCSTGQICKTQESGVDGGTATSSCASSPAACTTNQSCACIADSGVCSPTTIASCMDSQGHLVVDCMGQ